MVLIRIFQVTWTLISKPNPIVVDHTCEDVGMYEKYGSHTFVRIPKNVSGKIPLIAFIHGGPHSVSLKAYDLTFLCFCLTK